MTSKLGVYWSVMHRRPEDYLYFKQLRPSVHKIMDGGPNDYAWAREHLPGALIVARDWAMSEQHTDMLKDPVGTGHRHAQEWHGHQARLGFDRANTLVLGINEPRVWEPGVPEALRRYTVALCDEATRLGLRVGALQLSVGWPGNDGPETPPDWSPYHGVDNAIRRGNHVLVLHEYWADNGPGESWGWWAGRALKCPWQVPIVIGECGIDMYVKDTSGPHAARGWRGRKSPEQYAAELRDYEALMSADPRFVGCCVFASDYANREWASFDVQPAYQAILATPTPAPAPTEPPYTVRLPALHGNERTQMVIAISGANIRTAPDIETGDVVVAVPYGELVARGGEDVGSDGELWARVRYGDWSGWMRADLLDTSAAVTPTPADGKSNWERAWPVVLKFEGGLSLDPNDTGNYYQGKLVGTQFGISAAVWGGRYDIPNLTQAQALAIYREHYWAAAGCDALPWPLCLLHFDTAVNHGVTVAQQILAHVERATTEEVYLGLRLLRYVEDPKWRHFGIAWGNRIEHLDDIVDGEVVA